MKTDQEINMRTRLTLCWWRRTATEEAFCDTLCIFLQTSCVPFLENIQSTKKKEILYLIGTIQTKKTILVTLEDTKKSGTFKSYWLKKELKKEGLPLFPIVDEQGWRVFRRVSVPFSDFKLTSQLLIEVFVPDWKESCCCSSIPPSSFLSARWKRVWLRPHTSNSFKTSQTSLSTFASPPPFLASHCHNITALMLLVLMLA